MKIDYEIAFSNVQKQQILDKYGLDGGRTQKVIDSAFMGYVDKYMPADENQEMINSMYSSTKPGSGEININKPYAHYQNEGEKYVDSKTGKGAFYDPVSGRYWSRPGVKKVPSGEKLNYHGGANRGDHFTERMLADHYEDILNAGQKEIEK
ncbi:MAG: hypothetical protein J6K45_04690 [Clostridia bacterium]|nr:hypothetical protein [Clostridia bacterium]